MNYMLTVFGAVVVCSGLWAADCPAPRIVQVLPLQRSARVVLFDVGDDVDSVRIYLGGDGFRDPLRDSADTVYTFSDPLPGGGFNLYDLRPAGNYVAVARAYCDGQGGNFSTAQRFRTERAGPPRGDDPGQAIILAGGAVRCNYFPATTRDATGPHRPGDSCDGDADDDVWYRLRAIYPAYSLSVRPIAGTDQDLVVQVYDQEGQVLACVDRAGPGGTEAYELENLEKNQAVDIRIFTRGTDGYADFEVCSRGIPTRPIATGQACTEGATIKLDGTEEGIFVPITDSLGNIIAGIENSLPLGEVGVDYYLHDGGTRVAGDQRARYASRNVTLRPAVQPESPLGLRIYLREAEVRTLVELGAISGVDDLAVTKVEGTACSRFFPGGGEEVSWRRAGRYGDGYFVEVEVNSLGEFFLHPAAESLATTTGWEGRPRTPGDWRLFPNPARETLHLVPPGEARDRSVFLWVVDARGRVLAKQEAGPAAQWQVPTGHLSPGVYTLLIEDARGQRRSLRFVR